MSALNRAALKLFFETGDLPTEAQFADLIDSSPNIIDDLADDPADLIAADLLLTTAQVLALNTTPQTIVAAPGAGKVIEYKGGFVHVIFNGVAYITNTTLEIIPSGASAAQSSHTILNATADTIRNMPVEYVGTTAASQLSINNPLQLSVMTGDPVAGNSDVHVYITYRIVTL